MSFDYAFIERIGGRSALHPDAGPPADIFAAVREALILLLNTRRGQVAHLPDYGLPDLSDIYQSYPHSLFSLGRAIRDTIDKYEPRIQNLEVTLLSSSKEQFEARFTIRGTLITPQGEGQAVRFQTTLSQNGHIQVQ